MEEKRRRRLGRPKGPRSQRVTFDLFWDDAELFKQLCDERWNGCTYKEGFRRLLALVDHPAASSEDAR